MNMIRIVKVNTKIPAKQSSSCVVVGVYDNDLLSPSAESLDSDTGGYLSEMVARGNLAEAIGSHLLLLNIPSINAESVLLVRCGKQQRLSISNFQNVVTAAIKEIQRAQMHDALIYLTEIAVESRELDWNIRQIVEIAHDCCYENSEYKSKAQVLSKLKRLDIGLIDKHDEERARLAIKQARAISVGKACARQLADAPPNICSPEYVASQAKSMAASLNDLSIEVLGEQELKELGMQALLSVGAGSHYSSKLAVMNYSGRNSSAKPIVLVGKGITFDAGGLSLKGADAMQYMKYDMCGAAVVYGVMAAVAELGLNINVIGVLALAENMPDGAAMRPGDIVTTMSGKTVEILNTDAEGRLALCDALTYVERFEPETVIDVATLTGAAKIALGTNFSAVFTDDNKLAKALIGAGGYTQDKVWRLPIETDYKKYLASNIADMNNLGIREGGAITAACFLSHFTESYSWAHLDIAGSACIGESKNGASGRPVAMLTQYIIDRALE